MDYCIRYNGGERPQWVEFVDDGGVQMTNIIFNAEYFSSEKECRQAIALLTIGYGIGDLQLSEVLND